jgi:hypothetical protein
MYAYKLAYKVGYLAAHVHTNCVAVRLSGTLVSWVEGNIKKVPEVCALTTSTAWGD